LTLEGQARCSCESYLTWVVRPWFQSSLSVFMGGRLDLAYPFRRSHSCGSLRHWVSPPSFFDFSKQICQTLMDGNSSLPTLHSSPDPPLMWEPPALGLPLLLTFQNKYAIHWWMDIVHCTHYTSVFLIFLSTRKKNKTS
jgi:hypothetical protein